MITIPTVRTCIHHLKTNSALMQKFLQASGRSRAATGCLAHPPHSCLSGRRLPRPSLALLGGLWRPGLPSVCHAPVAGTRLLHTAERGATKYREKDGLSPDHQLVYVAGMDWYLRLCAAGVALPVPLAIASAPTLLTSTVLLSSAFVLSVLGVTYVAVVYNLFTLVRRYVLRMYYNRKENSYVAVFTGPLMFNVRLVTLPAGSVREEINATSPLPWNKFLYSYRGGKLIMYASGFRTGNDFNRLLGYGVKGDVDDE